MNNYKTEIVVKWTVADIKAMYSSWSMKKCELALDEVSRDVTNRVIEMGNQVLDQLVQEWEWSNEVFVDED